MNVPPFTVKSEPSAISIAPSNLPPDTSISDLSEVVLLSAFKTVFAVISPPFIFIFPPLLNIYAPYPAVASPLYTPLLTVSTPPLLAASVVLFQSAISVCVNSQSFSSTLPPAASAQPPLTAFILTLFKVTSAPFSALNAIQNFSVTDKFTLLISAAPSLILILIYFEVNFPPLTLTVGTLLPRPSAFALTSGVAAMLFTGLPVTFSSPPVITKSPSFHTPAPPPSSIASETPPFMVKVPLFDTPLDEIVPFASADLSSMVKVPWLSIAYLVLGLPF